MRSGNVVRVSGVELKKYFLYINKYLNIKKNKKNKKKNKIK